MTSCSPYRAFTKGTPLSCVQLELDFLFCGGDHWALPYAHLVSSRFDASGTILLTFTAHEVKIEGRNLGELYTGILHHDIEVVREVDPRHTDLAESESVVDKLSINSISG